MVIELVVVFTSVVAIVLLLRLWVPIVDPKDALVHPVKVVAVLPVYVMNSEPINKVPLSANVEVSSTVILVKELKFVA